MPPIPPLISSILQAPTGPWEQEVQHALAAIDSLHGCAGLSSVPILVGQAQNGTGGYCYNTQTQQPIRITLDVQARYPIYTCLHEIGHWIDHHGLAPAGCFNSESFHIPDWSNAVKNSTAVQELQTHLRWKSFFDPDRDEQVSISHKTIRYNLRDDELFAHCYAHFVALYGTNPVVCSELQRFHEEIDALVHFPLWEEADFASIAQEMKTLFQRQGWLR
jgi:hypothetical protein